MNFLILSEVSVTSFLIEATTNFAVRGIIRYDSRYPDKYSQKGVDDDIFRATYNSRLLASNVTVDLSFWKNENDELKDSYDYFVIYFQGIHNSNASIKAINFYPNNNELPELIKELNEHFGNYTE